VVTVIGVVQAEALQRSEMGFDGVQPTGIGRRRDQADVVAASEVFQDRVPVRGEVVQDEVNACLFGVTGAQASPGRHQVAAGLALVDRPGQTIVMDVVEGQELLRTGPTVIGGAESLRVFLGRPADPRQGSEFQRAALVETDHGALGRRLRIQSQNAVFFDSKSGSGDSFHVLVR
jgi:hypothetical protein